MTILQNTMWDDTYKSEVGFFLGFISLLLLAVGFYLFLHNIAFSAFQNFQTISTGHTQTISTVKGRG